MLVFTVHIFTLWLSVIFPVASVLGSIAKKTKLCGDESCTEKLFEGKFHRSSIANHESFLSPSENDVVNVYAIKFSDRTDLMEGALEREPEKRGNFFTMHINLDGYVEFLKNAIKSNKTMFLISMDPYDHPAHRMIGLKSALPELIKDYEVHARRLSEEKHLPPPENIDYEALGYKPQGTGHGESHNSGHEHSHDHSYTHMHEHEQEQVDYHMHRQSAALLTETAVPPPPVTGYSKNVPKVHNAQALEQLELVMASNGISDVPKTLVISGPSQISVSEQTLEPSKSVKELTVNDVSTTASTAGSQKQSSGSNNVPSTTVLVERALKHDVHGKQEMPPEHVQKLLSSHSNLQNEEQISVASASSPIPEIDNGSSWSSSSSKPQPSSSSQAINIAEANPSLSTVSISQTNHQPVTDIPEISPSSSPVTSAVTVKESLPVPTVRPDTTSTVTALENEPSEQITVSPSTMSPQNVLSPPEGRSNIDETSVDSIGERNSAETHRKSENVEPRTQTEDEVRTDIMEEDGLGYCIKGDCNRVYSSPQTDKKPESAYLMVAGNCLSKLISLLRYILPSPIKHIDDAGVVVTFFVPICLLIHLVRVLIFEDTNERDTFDRRTLHNALTAIRERDVKMKMLHAEMEKGRSAVNSEMEKKLESFQLQIGEQLLEIQHLKAKCGDLEEENNNLKAEKDETGQLIEKEWLRCRDLTERNNKLGEKIEMLMKELSDMSVALEAARKENERLDSDVSNKNAMLTRFESEAKSHSLEMKNLRDQLKTSVAESKMFQQRVEELQNETVQLSQIIKEMHDAGNIVGGATAAQFRNSEQVCENGNDEGGWSDFGDFGMDDSTTNKKSKKQCSSAVWSSSTDIIEVAKLRAQLKNVEADLDRAKLTLQKQENEREHLIRKVELAESDATKRLREVEAKEVERVEAHNQFKRILSMVEEREAKLRNSEELMEKLRSDVADWQEKVRQIEEEKRLVEIKFSETEQELKRLKTDYSRLETRKFHEMRECKQTIAALQQSLEQARLLNPSSNTYNNANLHNLSASSSDRDCCAPVNAGLVVPPLPSVRPLWVDEPNEVLPGGESSLLRNVGSVLNDRAVGSSNLLYKKTRRSFKDREFNSGATDGVQSRHKKETRRMRSRSQGRHPFNVDYFTSLGYPARADLYTNTMLSKQHSKSGTMYYSSGGSNSGRSPPPEIALLSGVPPPGPMIKKPTPRPKSSTVIVERRQN